MPKSTASGPTIIDDNDDVTPPPCQGQTCAQHQFSHVHLINFAITKALMLLIDLKPTAFFPAHGYIAATQALLENTCGMIHKTNSPANADSFNFIGAIIDNITGNVLEYCHLNKSESYRTIWQHSFANKLGCLFQGICNIKGTDACFFICKVGSVATIVPKRMNHIVLDSPLVGNELRTTATKAPPPQHLSQPNSSSTQGF
jgi:hypothetical protein